MSGITKLTADHVARDASSSKVVVSCWQVPAWGTVCGPIVAARREQVAIWWRNGCYRRVVSISVLDLERASWRLLSMVSEVFTVVRSPNRLKKRRLRTRFEHCHLVADLDWLAYPGSATPSTTRCNRHVTGPVHDFKNLLLGAVKADLTAVDSSLEPLGELLRLLHNPLRLHGLPASRHIAWVGRPWFATVLGVRTPPPWSSWWLTKYSVNL